MAVLSAALGLGVAFVPPIHWVLDAVTAVALFVMLGFPWRIHIAVAVEVVPALALFPAWTLLVLALAGAKNAPAGLKDRRQVVQTHHATQEPV